MSFNFKCVRFGFAVRPYRRSKGCWKIVVYFITEFRLFLSCIGQILFFFKSTNKLKWSILEKEKKKMKSGVKNKCKKKKNEIPMISPVARLPHSSTILGSNLLFGSQNAPSMVVMPPPHTLLLRQWEFLSTFLRQTASRVRFRATLGGGRRMSS